MLALTLSQALYATSTAPTVFVKTAKLSEISQNLSYPAIVQAKIQATVLAESDGVVRKIHAQLGQPARARVRLFTIQQTDPIFQYASVGTPSPVTGVVSELNITEGALVTKGQKLATVTNPNSLKILVEVPAQDLPLLTNGLVGELESPALSGKIALTLVGLSPTVDPATGTATAELAPSASQMNLLRPGVIGKVTFKANLRHGFLVPEDALVESQRETFLRIVENGKAKKVPVTVGARLRGMAEISKGLASGMKVVERTSGFVGEGEAVKVQE